MGGGEVCGRTTGAKALFCLTAETIWTGENESGGGGGDGNEQVDREEVSDRMEMSHAGGGGGGGADRAEEDLEEPTCSEHEELQVWQS